MPVCSVELLECYLHKLFCTCETVPGLARFADFVDVCGLVAPRPLLLVHGYLDQGFLVDSARKARARVQLIYNALGAGDRLAHFISYDNHAYNREMREAVYGWFDRWLKGLEPPYAPEVAVPIESHDDLRVFPGGLPEGHVTLRSMAVARTRDLPPRKALTTRQAWELEAARLRARLAELFSGWPAVTPLDTRAVKAGPESIGGVAA
ncbi:MAG: hypothetical protein HYU66_27905, partial [Armatimonadetes bacterium]|nr:hypothetical protein [Armatimonadota bacterium]